MRGGAGQDLGEGAGERRRPVGQRGGNALEAGHAVGADVEQDGGLGGARLGEGEGQGAAAVDKAGAGCAGTAGTVGAAGTVGTVGAIGADLLGAVEVAEGHVVQAAGALGQRRAAQAGVDARGHGVDAADADVPFGLGGGQPADDEGVGHDQGRDAGGCRGPPGDEVGSHQAQGARDDGLVAAGKPARGLWGRGGFGAGRVPGVADLLGLDGAGVIGLLRGSPAGIPEPLGEEGRQYLAGGVRVQVGQGVDVQAVRAVGAGDGDRPVDLGDAGADGQALSQEVGAEAEALGGVVVARGEDHPGQVRQAAQGLIQKADRVGGRDGAVVDVPGHDDGVDRLAAGELDEVVGEGRLGVVQDAPVEGAPQVPVGGVQDPHGCTLSQGCDANEQARMSRPCPRPAPSSRSVRPWAAPSIGASRIAVVEPMTL